MTRVPCSYVRMRKMEGYRNVRCRKQVGCDIRRLKVSKMKLEKTLKPLRVHVRRYMLRIRTYRNVRTHMHAGAAVHIQRQLRRGASDPRSGVNDNHGVAVMTMSRSPEIAVPVSSYRIHGWNIAICTNVYPAPRRRASIYIYTIYNLCICIYVYIYIYVHICT
jgi:hypothetical protein